MEKFFDCGSLSDEEMVAGLKKQVSEGKIYPVLYTSATGNIGVQPLLNAILNLLPDAVARGSVTGKDTHGKEIERKMADSEPFSAFVFKTFSDPFTGRISLFRVYSGMLTTETAALQRQQGRRRALRLDRPAAGQDAGRRSETARRRYRRRRETERDANRRHALRQGPPDHLSRR